MRNILFTLAVMLCAVLGANAQNKQPAKGCSEAYETFGKLQNALLAGNYETTIAAFSDSLVSNYKDLDGNGLKEFINNYCFVNRDFLRAIKTNHVKVNCKSKVEFTVFIYARSRKRPDEYMDAKDSRENYDDEAGSIWYLKFRKTDSGYKVVVIDRAS